MLTTAHYTNRHRKSQMNQQYWIDYHNIQIPWLNFLTSQSIPEETDTSECFQQYRTNSESSLSSDEECYIVLEVPKPRLNNEINQQLNYAQINEYEQCVQSEIIDIPSKEQQVIEHQCEEINDNEKVIQRTNHILFHIPQKFDKFISVSDEDFSSLTNEKNQTSNKLIIETKILKRIFTYDDSSIEKYHRVKEQKRYHIDIKSNSSISKSSKLFRSIKDRTRHMKNKYTFSTKQIKSNEPELLHVKYLDGRPSLIDPDFDQSDNICNSQRKQIFHHFRKLFFK
ncbi:hypothetical protein I4U23_014420 [Adineta vaga]|nr:hypothetical protein I4U23_014420 [Adineta vaga]